MKGALFFTCLCLLLLCGTHAAYTGSHRNSTSHAPTQHVQKKNAVTITHPGSDYSIIKDNSLHKEAADLISEEVEDEDANNAFARKCRWLSRDNGSCFSLFNLSILHGRLKAAQPFYGNLPGKYITLRVLRI